MKAELDKKKLYLFYDNEEERSKMFDFLNILVKSERPVNVGLLEMKNEYQRIGLFLQIMIDDPNHHLHKISDMLEGKNDT